MRIVISQPRYLPALNYIQRMAFADKFVILDVVQRQARGWENRNKLLLPNPTWLTIPVASSSRALIMDSMIDGKDWVVEHKRKIQQNYEKAPFFSKRLLDDLYTLNNGSNNYATILVSLLENIYPLLSLRPNLVLASSLLHPPEYAEGGVSILRKISERICADCYVSGPNGKEYGVQEEFERTAIEVLFHEFKHPVYEQNSETFIPYMGFFDALFYSGVDWLTNFVKTAPDLRGCND